MDDVINRGNPIAEQNTNLNGRPAKGMFDNWKEEVQNWGESSPDDSKDEPADSPEVREKKIKEMEEIIKKDLE